MAGAGKKNADYWKRRFEAMEDAGYQKSREYYERIQRAFDRAEQSIRADLERWYTRLAKNNHISLAEAKKLLGRDELAEFKWTVEDYIKAGEENALNQNWMKELENASARHHINYLNAMKIQIRQHAEELYARYESSLAKHLSDTFRDTYYHTAYEIETGLEVGSSLVQPDTRKIDTFINRPWAADGANFSDRIWTDKKKLVNSLNTELTQSIIRGEDPEKAIQSLSKTMGVSKNNAGRLIMTESAAVSSAAQKECFRELDVEQYQIVATLDSVTSELCRSLDGKIFRMSEYETGVTAPPFHPWCRTTTVPYFEDNDSVRAARGKDGKTYYVDGKLTYQEWEKTLEKRGLAAGNGNTEEGFGHKKPVKLGEVDFSDKDMVLSKLKEYEKLIADEPVENAIIITKDGVITRCFGNLNGVYPDVDLGEHLIGAYMTHNHPVGSDNEYSFSDLDIRLFMEYNLEVLRGIDERYIYELTRNPEEIDKHLFLFEMTSYDSRHENVISEAEKIGIGYRRYSHGS